MRIEFLFKIGLLLFFIYILFWKFPKSKKKLDKPVEGVVDVTLGAYSLETGKIFYNYRLDKYPELKKKILDHETQHHTDTFLLKILWRELIDYIKIYNSNEFEVFHQGMLEEEKKKLNLTFFDRVRFMFLGVIYQIVVSFIFVFAHLIRVVRKLIKKIKKN